MLVIFARSILAKTPGATVISEVKCSQRLFDDIEKNGGEPIMWKVGHSLLKAKMKETGALLVRPDQHVAWRAASLPDQPGAGLAAALTRILGEPE